LLKLIEVAGNMNFPSAVDWLERETGIPSPGRLKKGTGAWPGRSTWGILWGHHRFYQDHGVRTWSYIYMKPSCPPVALWKVAPAEKGSSGSCVFSVTAGWLSFFHLIRF
jgi:hypothetical protein